MKDEALRQTGISVVGDVPWGTHFFLFHETAEDLIDACVPYIRAGLENRELCIWVIADPLTEEEVRYCLKHAIPGFDDYFDKRSIEIVRGREWYMTGNELDLGRVTRGWKQRMDRALNGGYAGFRLSADTAWLDKRDWKEFCEYEKEVNESIGDTQMLALCTYPLRGTGAAEILDVTHTHQFAVARRNKKWELMESSELKQAKAEILKLNNNLERRVLERTKQLAAVNEELRWEMGERQRAEEALRAAHAELAHVTRVTAMGELAASIAHEVTQPLTGIVTNGNACLHWLAADPPNIEKARTTVKRIIRDGDRAGEVIRDIRGLVKKAPPRQEPIDLNDLISRMLALTNNEMTRHQVEAQTELAADLPSVLGDRVQLQQVLLNLIMNALEAMSSISGPRLLTVKSENLQDRKSVAIAVTDSGIGLNSYGMKRIFDAFYTTKPQGMGMGLSICHNIIESHGGHLTGVSNMDQGATFEFTLPAYQETVRIVSTWRQRDAPATQGGPTNQTVFLIDDDVSVREGLTMLIESVGLAAQCFGSAQEFLDTPLAAPNGCIVLDMNMPGMNGLDLQRELNALGLALPVIFLTGHGDIPMTVRALKAGATHFLTKLVQENELIGAIRQA